MSKGKQPATDGLRTSRPGPPSASPAVTGRPVANGSAERPLSEAERGLLRQLQNVKRELGTLVESLEAAEEGEKAEDRSVDSAAAAAPGPPSSTRGGDKSAAVNGKEGQEAKESMGAGTTGGKGHQRGSLSRGALRPPSLALGGAGGLHVAMVKERIKGLLSQRKKLEAQLWELRDSSGGAGTRPATNGKRAANHRFGTSSGAGTASSGGGGNLGKAQDLGPGRGPPARNAPSKLPSPRNGIRGADAAGRSGGGKEEAAAAARSGDGGAGGLIEGDDLDLELGLDDQPAQLVETERDKLIRTGAITPFDRLQGFAKGVVRGQAGPASGTAAGGSVATVRGASVGGSAGGTAGRADGALAVSERRGLDILERARAGEEPRLRTKILEPHEVPKERVVPEYEFGAMYRRSSAAAAQKRKRAGKGRGKGRLARPQPSKEWRKRRRAEERREEVREFLQSDESGGESGSGDEYSPEEGEDGEEEEDDEEAEEESGEAGSSQEEDDPQGPGRKNGRSASHGRRAGGSQRPAGRGARSSGAAEGGESEDDVVLEGGLKIPGAVYRRLFEYQRTAVRWMWELHCQEVGGILGDEMGLGKTVQVAAFLGALHHSGLFRPSLIVCPVTLLRQWAKELRKWCPALRPTILHSVVGKGAVGAAGSEEEEEEEEEEELEREEALRNGGDEGAAAKARRQEKRGRAFGAALRKALRHRGSVVLTTYEQIRACQDWVLPEPWGYAILDEGHKIRNPDAGVTLACKQLRTPHRLLLTGCPIQNRLSELWSLLDFAYPGRLGTLPVFSAEFAQPISLGGYASASGIQVSTAYRCALYLRDIILPYLLRRVKRDLALQLPRKTEHVLLCKLTDYQRRLYRAFLGSEEVSQILDQRRNMLYGIDILRKVCNHPDLVTDADGWEGHERDWVQQAQHEARVVAASGGAADEEYGGGTQGEGKGTVRGEARPNEGPPCGTRDGEVSGQGAKDSRRGQGATPAPQGVPSAGQDPESLRSRSRSRSPLPEHVGVKEERAEDGEMGEGGRASAASEGARDGRAERAARRKWDPLAADEEDEEFVFGEPRRSAKLQVAQKILEQWRAEGHKALVFCQTQQMLDILEALVVRHGWVYRRMDGSTPAGQRSVLIDEFNSTQAATKAQAMDELSAARGAGRGGAGGRAVSSSDALQWDNDCMEEPIFVFLLTTRVGGLGTNLTAANRVLIFDPDWNPSTDLQARERAWRIGQQREVVIYRLLTKGTIEEKVYQRQIVKQQLSSRVLKDPRQRRLFKERDVREIFKLADGDEDGGLPVCHPDNPLQAAVVVGGAGPGEGGGAGQGGEGRDGEGGEGEEEGPDGGASILKKLFDGKDIYAALDHGAVEKLAGDIPQWAAARAAETAARAAQALRDSHALRSNASVAEPTWTGRSGSAGIPTGRARNRFGATSVVRPQQPGSALAPSSLSTSGSGIRPLPGVVHSASSSAAAGSPVGAAGVPAPGGGVRPSGMAVSSADLLSRLRERRLAATGGGASFGGGAPALPPPLRKRRRLGCAGGCCPGYAERG